LYGTSIPQDFKYLEIEEESLGEKRAETTDYEIEMWSHVP